MDSIILMLRLGFAVVVFSFFVGCGACNDDPKLLDPCKFGRVDSCTCDDSRQGTRQCSDDGEYSECDCSESDDPNNMADNNDVDMGPPTRPGCIMLDPEALDFGPVSVFGTASREVTILNCAYATSATLKTLQTCTSESGPEDCEPSTEFDVMTMSGLSDITIPALTTATVNVTFTPPDLETYTGRLDVVTESGHSDSVELTGMGDSCPQPVAEARVVDTMDWAESISTIPLETLEFTAMNSIAPGGAIGEFEWALIQRPTGSTTTLLPDGNAEQPTLFLDLAGNYVVELTLFDPVTGESCGESAQVQISALPDREIHIQLVWDTPLDPDQTDNTGTDVDLHFLHPMGTWDVAPYDIYWANKTADWGMPGPDDDPSLDIDDVTGAGPENINMGTGENNATYQIGVYYFAENNWGTSNSTIRIYLRGVQEFEQVGVPLNVTGDFWLVATITSPSNTIIPINEVIQGFPPMP